MKRSQRPRAACALSLAAMLAAGRGFGQPSSQAEPTRFVFQAPPGCGSAEDFSARVAKRSARIRLVAEGSAARSLLVEIQPPDAAGVLRGDVTVVEPDGATRARQLRASTCEEALDGLSLIATVTLDPEALMGEPAPPPEKPPPPAPVSAKPAAKPPAPPLRSEPPAPYRLSFGLAGALLVSAAPEPAFGGQASLQLELSPGSLLAPAFRIGVSHTQVRGVPLGPGEANFAHTLPMLEVCPVRLGPRVFGLRPCGFVSAGLVHAWGTGTRARATESHLSFFGSAGPSLVALLRLGKTFEIIADGRAGLAFKRDQFAFDGVPFFTTPALGFSSALGVTGGFP